MCLGIAGRVHADTCSFCACAVRHGTAPVSVSVLSLISGAVEGAGRIGLVGVWKYGRSADLQTVRGTVGIAFSLVLVAPFVSHSIRYNHKPGGSAAHACEQVWPQPLPKNGPPAAFTNIRDIARAPVRPARVSACAFCLCVFLSCPPVRPSVCRSVCVFLYVSSCPYVHGRACVCLCFGRVGKATVDKHCSACGRVWTCRFSPSLKPSTKPSTHSTTAC